MYVIEKCLEEMIPLLVSSRREDVVYLPKEEMMFHFYIRSQLLKTWNRRRSCSKIFSSRRRFIKKNSLFCPCVKGEYLEKNNVFLMYLRR